MEIIDEPKVGDSVFSEDGTLITEIGAIICHYPFEIFGRDGKTKRTKLKLLL